MTYFSKELSPGQSTKTNGIKALIRLTAIVLCFKAVSGKK